MASIISSYCPSKNLSCKRKACSRASDAWLVRRWNPHSQCPPTHQCLYIWSQQKSAWNLVESREGVIHNICDVVQKRLTVEPPWISGAAPQARMVNWSGFKADQICTLPSSESWHLRRIYSSKKPTKEVSSMMNRCMAFWESDCSSLSQY